MDPAPTTFANHRGVVPLLWVFSAIAVLELVVVHLFVALKWPWIGWPLTVLSALSIVWLVRWIRSWPLLPHELVGGVLTLHMGSLRHFAVPTVQIGGVRTAVSDAVLKAPGTVNLVPIAYPNRIIDLIEPLPGRPICHIALRLDDPAAFDATMTGLGIAVVQSSVREICTSRALPRWGRVGMGVRCQRGNPQPLPTGAGSVSD